MNVLTSGDLSELGFEPAVSRVTLHEGVYLRLSHALMAGRFDPGQTLTIASLSELFGTSHMPVREALRRLAAENAVEIASTGSAHVPNVTRAHLDDLSNARAVVEGAVAEMAAQHATPALADALRQAAAQHVEAVRRKDVAGILAHNQQFHFTLYRASRSVVLVQLIEKLWLQYGPYLRMLTKYMEPRLDGTDVETYAEHHFEVIKALVKKDGPAVRRHTVDDIQTTQQLLQTLCDAEPASRGTAEPVKGAARKAAARRRA
ncbi:MAG TPA: GntR family transcriptional regulator [Ramlibacter sp.]|nr:GntR family transcriptional regulator [Ramlibacter sp.]